MIHRFTPKVRWVQNFEVAKEASINLQKEIQSIEKRVDVSPLPTDVDGEKMFATFVRYGAYDLLALLLEKKWHRLNPEHQYLQDLVGLSKNQTRFQYQSRNFFRSCGSHDTENLQKVMTVLFKQGASYKRPFHHDYFVRHDKKTGNFSPLHFLAFSAGCRFKCGVRMNYEEIIAYLPHQPLSEETFDTARCESIRFWLHYDHKLEEDNKYLNAIQEAMQDHAFPHELSYLIAEFAVIRVDVNEKDSFGLTPLNYVAPGSRTEELLLEHGAHRAPLPNPARSSRASGCSRLYKNFLEIAFTLMIVLDSIRKSVLNFRSKKKPSSKEVKKRKCKCNRKEQLSQEANVNKGEPQKSRQESVT